MSGILKIGGSDLINDNGGSGALQWGSGVPSGSVINTYTFNSSEQVINEVSQFLPISSTDTSIQIPNYTKGNKLIFWVGINTKLREGTNFYMSIASYYLDSSSSGASTPSTSSPWVLHNDTLGFFETVTSTTGNDSLSSTLLDVITVSGSGTTNIDYALRGAFGDDPSEIRDYKRHIIVQEIKA
tara:strand:+ start:306 stop:857 length:552 start_codon:yes stop_codon:yes gene_type:complete